MGDSSQGVDEVTERAIVQTWAKRLNTQGLDDVTIMTIARYWAKYQETAPDITPAARNAAAMLSGATSVGIRREGNGIVMSPADGKGHTAKPLAITAKEFIEALRTAELSASRAAVLTLDRETAQYLVGVMNTMPRSPSVPATGVSGAAGDDLAAQLAEQALPNVQRLTRLMSRANRSITITKEGDKINVAGLGGPPLSFSPAEFAQVMSGITDDARRHNLIDQCPVSVLVAVREHCQEGDGPNVQAEIDERLRAISTAAGSGPTHTAFTASEPQRPTEPPFRTKPAAASSSTPGSFRRP